MIRWKLRLTRIAQPTLRGALTLTLTLTRVATAPTMARMMWLIGLLSLGVFSKAQSIGGPLGQATGRRRGVRRPHPSRRIDRRRAAANVELSVVIPAKDAGKQISDLLESLTTVPLATEVIVVDDGSADDTVEAVEAFLPRPRLLRNSVSKGAGRARNRQAEKSRGLRRAARMGPVGAGIVRVRTPKGIPRPHEQHAGLPRKLPQGRDTGDTRVPQISEGGFALSI